MGAREKLIDAADRCLLEKGSHAACVKIIAETAGVNHGLVHHYFGSKEGLFIALMKRYFNTIIPDPDLVFNSEEDVVAYFKNSIIPSARIMIEFRAMSFHMPELRRELISMAIELRKCLINIFHIQEEQALILMSSVLGLGFHSFLEPSIDVEKHMQIMANLVLKERIGNLEYL